MNDTCVTPDCGKPVTYRSAGLCKTCYKRQWWRDNVQKKDRIPNSETTYPISYTAAHMKLRTHRGRARDYKCQAGCGAQAQEWAYRNASPYEQVGTETVYMNGKTYETNAKWSPYIWDYDPLCRQCHYKRDGRVSS